MKTTNRRFDKADTIAICIILLVFTAMVLLTYAKWGEELVDCFRNACIAEELYRGKLLYKDIYYVYGPMVVYFHSFLFGVFGVNLSVLYTCGIVIAAIISGIAYTLSRQFFKPLPATLIVTLFIIQMVFRPTLFQYIFPYSYETLYGSLLFFGSLLSIVIYIKKDYKDSLYLYIPAILTSLALFIKQDIAFSIYLSFYVFCGFIILTKKTDLKGILWPFIITIAVPVAGFALLSLVIPYNFLTEYLFPLKRVPYVAFIKWESLKFDIKTFLLFLIGYSILAFIFYTLSRITDSILTQVNNLLKSVGILTILAVVFINLFIDFSTSNNMTDFINHTYIWSFLFLFALFCYQLYRIIFLKHTLSYEETVLFSLTLYSMLFLIRFPLEVKLQTYCNLFLFPALLIITYYLFIIPGQLFTNIHKEHYNTSFCLTIIIFSACVFINYNIYYSYRNVLVQTPRGTIYSSPFKGSQILKTLQFIKKNTSKTDTIFCPPEDLIYNFLSARPLPTRYSQLLPGIVYDEDQAEIIKQLEKNKPAVITVSTNDVIKLYGNNQWGIDYNREISEWIQKNYLLKEVVTQNIAGTNEKLPYQVYIFTPIEE